MVKHRPHRRGSSYLEVQVAMVVFAVGVSGLVPLAVVNSRQLRAIGQRHAAEQTHYLVPPEHAWSAKLGGGAEITPDAPPPRPVFVDLIDDGQTGFTLQDVGEIDWQVKSSTKSYLLDYRKNDGSGIGDKAIWTFNNLAPMRYEVRVTYPHDEDFASNSPFKIFDGASLLATIPVNQRTPPAGPSYNLRPWDNLGHFLIQSGTLRVELSDSANDDIVADAVRIVPRVNQLQVLALYPSLADSTLEVHLSVVAP